MPDLIVMTPNPERMLQLLDLPANVSARAAANEEEALALGSEATVLLINPRKLTQRLVDGLPRLRWIQLMSAGADALLNLRLPQDVVVTTASGIHGPQMSELVFLYMLSLLRDVRGLIHAQRNARWEEVPQRLLTGRRVLLVGLGSIAESLARRCAAFDMEVHGASNSRTHAPDVAVVHPMDDLCRAVRDMDFVVVLTPYSVRTRHLIGREVLDAMPASAYLINVARGQVVDEDALVTALRNGAIAGAGLDVFETEPLPAENPLWRMRNVMVTSHIGGLSDIYLEQLAPLVSANLARWFASPPQPLSNPVRD